MKYQDLLPIELKEAKETLYGNCASDIAIKTLYRLSFYSNLSNWQEVQEVCLYCLKNPLEEIKKAAIVSLGYVARFARKINSDKVLPVLKSISFENNSELQIELEITICEINKLSDSENQ